MIHAFSSFSVKKIPAKMYYVMCVLMTFAFVMILGDSNSVFGDQQCGQGKKERITLNRGETLDLPCILRSILEKNQLITWRKATGDTLIRCKTPKKCSYYPSYDRQRFGVLTNYENNFTIRITNTKTIDSATYFCELLELPELHGGSIPSCNVSIVTLNVTEQSVQNFTSSPSHLTQEISSEFSTTVMTVSMVNVFPVVSIISSTALLEISKKSLPRQQKFMQHSEKSYTTFIILAVTITTFLILLLSAAFCCILFANKFGIYLRLRNSALIRRVNIHDSDMLEMKLIQDGEEEHEGEESQRQRVLNKERITCHFGSLRPQSALSGPSKHAKTHMADEDYLIPQPVSSDENYESVECLDQAYFLVNRPDSKHDGTFTTGTSLQPASQSLTSALVEKSSIINEEIAVLNNMQSGISELPASLQLLAEAERTEDFKENTNEGLPSKQPPVPSMRPHLLHPKRGKHLSCPPSLGDSKIILSSDAVSSDNPCPFKMPSTMSEEGPIVSRNSNEHKDINDKGHDDNYEIPVLQHPLGMLGAGERSTEGSLSPPISSLLRPPNLPPGQPSPRLLPRIPSPTQHTPPLPPSPRLPTPMPAITLKRRQQLSRLLPLPPVPKERTIPPPPPPPPSTVLSLLPPGLHGGYNSLINMTYERVYNRLKH